MYASLKQRARGEIIIEDMLQQKKSLMFCFICLDMDKDGYIDLGTFKSMMEKAFDNRVAEENIIKVYKSIAVDLSRRVNMEKFTDLVNVMQGSKYLFAKRPIEVWAWNKTRDFLNKYLKIRVIVQHWLFEAVLFLVVLANTVIMVWIMTDPPEPTLTRLNTIDDNLLYVYTAEIALRIVATGVIEYFSDPWNQFDFFLVSISYATDVALSALKLARNARTARFLRISRLQKTLRIGRSAKGARIFKFCMGIMQSFYRIKQLIEIIIISIPTIWRTFSLILIIFYLYSMIGMEFLRQGKLVYPQIPPYGISDFQNFGSALLELAHVMIANGWSDLMYSWCQRYNSRTPCMLFFMSFNAIINIVLRSLLSGLVWEVFSFVDKNTSTNTASETTDIEVEMLTRNLHKNYFSKLRKEACLILYSGPEEELQGHELEGLKPLREDLPSKSRGPAGNSLLKKRMSDNYRNPFSVKNSLNMFEKRSSLINAVYNSIKLKTDVVLPEEPQHKQDPKVAAKESIKDKKSFDSKPSLRKTDGSANGEKSSDQMLGTVLPPIEPPCTFGTRGSPENKLIELDLNYENNAPEQNKDSKNASLDSDKNLQSSLGVIQAKTNSCSPSTKKRSE